MLIKRELHSKILSAIQGEPRVIVLYGPRQAGKTTLISQILEETGIKALKFTGDDLYTQKIFGQPELEALKPIIGNNTFLVIDEAQRITNIGLTLKLLFDNLPLTIVTSGSSSFDLANKINEPLTGRTKTFFLYPLQYSELTDLYRQTSPNTALEKFLRFGMYPKIHTLTGEEEKQNYLFELLNNYLYRDILSFEKVRKPKKVVDLLALLALQIGKEVSIAELAQNLSLTAKAVENYLDILEKMFVIVNIRGFSRNLRKEIYKSSKYYFVDVGIRNALIRNFNPLELRADTGDLFENWFIMEKIKRSGGLANFYFWRTYDQQKIDLIEEKNGVLTGYECKWSETKKASPPKDWLNTYKEAKFEKVNRENYSGYLA
ncbi:MAG TPA: ATP-binding protein [Patescibacteria group bacterium]|nr:ATP-binding protein [Patescibacteria group bacterium]